MRKKILCLMLLVPCVCVCAAEFEGISLEEQGKKADTFILKTVEKISYAWLRSCAEFQTAYSLLMNSKAVKMMPSVDLQKIEKIAKEAEKFAGDKTTPQNPPEDKPEKLEKEIKVEQKEDIESLSPQKQP